MAQVIPVSSFVQSQEPISDTYAANSYGEVVPHYEIAHTFTEESLGGTAVSYTQNLGSSTYNLTITTTHDSQAVSQAICGAISHFSGYGG